MARRAAPRAALLPAALRCAKMQSVVGHEATATSVSEPSRPWRVLGRAPSGGARGLRASLVAALGIAVGVLVFPAAGRADQPVDTSSYQTTTRSPSPAPKRDRAADRAFRLAQAAGGTTIEVVQVVLVEPGTDAPL